MQMYNHTVLYLPSLDLMVLLCLLLMFHNHMLLLLLILFLHLRLQMLHCIDLLYYYMLLYMLLVMLLLLVSYPIMQNYMCTVHPLLYLDFRGLALFHMLLLLYLLLNHRHPTM